MIRSIAFTALALGFACASAAQPDDHASGYWKFQVPKENKPFGNDDVVELAQGRHVATDCSVPWIGGDGNTYCFKNVASREAFLHAPMDYFRQAQRVMERGQPAKKGDPQTSDQHQEATASPAVANVAQEK
jgi:hypothetical protein